MGGAFFMFACLVTHQWLQSVELCDPPVVCTNQLCITRVLMCVFGTWHLAQSSGPTLLVNIGTNSNSKGCEACIALQKRCRRLSCEGHLAVHPKSGDFTMT